MNEMKPLEAIRALSGVFPHSEATDRLALVNLVARVISGDAERKFAAEVLLKSTGIKLVFDD